MQIYQVALPCDFDGDLQCRHSNLDLMYQQGDLVAGVPVGLGNIYDLDSDLDIDNSDLDMWLESKANTTVNQTPGNVPTYLRSDTDGVNLLSINFIQRRIDVTDFNALANNFDPGGNNPNNFWSKGNFDGDNDVDVTDFNYLANNFAPGGYGATNAAVPEPSAILLTVCSLILTLPLSSVLVTRRPDSTLNAPSENSGILEFSRYCSTSPLAGRIGFSRLYP